MRMGKLESTRSCYHLQREMHCRGCRHLVAALAAMCVLAVTLNTARVTRSRRLTSSSTVVLSSHARRFPDAESLQPLLQAAAPAAALAAASPSASDRTVATTVPAAPVLLVNCSGTPHLELWGALVQPGDSNEQASASECCRSCREYEPTPDTLNGAQCNTWVYHPLNRQCWLKHQKPEELKHALAAIARGGGTKSPWVSGVNLEERPCTSCVVPASYEGCISKDRCNTSRACGSPAIDGYSHVVRRVAASRARAHADVAREQAITLEQAARAGGATPPERSLSRSLAPTLPQVPRAYSARAGRTQDNKCLTNSPTAVLYRALLSNGTRLVGVSEMNADYDGLGVRWGINHKKETWEQCEAACSAHNEGGRRAGAGPFNSLPCNAWTWCSRPKCFEPDAHSHSFGDCWLKFTELPWAPEVNMRTPMLKSFMRRHQKQMIDGVPWHAGALIPPWMKLGPGTWGPRAFW